MAQFNVSIWRSERREYLKDLVGHVKLAGCSAPCALHRNYDAIVPDELLGLVRSAGTT